MFKKLEEKIDSSKIVKEIFYNGRYPYSLANLRVYMEGALLGTTISQTLDGANFTDLYSLYFRAGMSIMELGHRLSNSNNDNNPNVSLKNYIIDDVARPLALFASVYGITKLFT